MKIGKSAFSSSEFRLLGFFTKIIGFSKHQNHTSKKHSQSCKNVKNHIFYVTFPARSVFGPFLTPFSRVWNYLEDFLDEFLK